MNVVALSGGVGGARFLRGVVETVAAEELTIVGNVGDDVEVLGLHVSPDLDSILYALTGRADDERGWGRARETWHALEAVAELGGETWFRLGDRDLGVHLVRTQALRRGERLSAITARLAERLGLGATLVPATDDELRTWLVTPAGTFPFQEWFVARGHRDEVDAVDYRGAKQADAAPGVLKALDAADLIVLAPSNPYVSIGPILAVRAVRAALERRRCATVAVSPLVGGRAVRGPADRMLARLAGGTSPAHVASCYLGLIDALVLDEADAGGAGAVAELGVEPIVTKTLMADATVRRRLAEAALDAAAALR
jgi:LPPG:FO 2-phospho-L-lactate transferase